MILNSKLKWFLVVSLKNAINAILINGALMFKWHFIFNFNNWAGVWAVAQATGAVILAREAAVWGPLLLKWTQTNADPTVAGAALDHAASVTKEIAADIQQAKENITPKP